MFSKTHMFNSRLYRLDSILLFHSPYFISCSIFRYIHGVTTKNKKDKETQDILLIIIRYTFTALSLSLSLSLYLSHLTQTHHPSHTFQDDDDETRASLYTNELVVLKEEDTHNSRRSLTHTLREMLRERTSRRT